MKANYPIEWVPATPEYLLACMREECRQSRLLDGDELGDVEQQLPTFESTVCEWREAMDLVGWRPLGQALNEEWGTHFAESQWFSVLMPAREKTLRGVCELLATQVSRPVVPPAKMAGRECASAGVFLAIRSVLLQAGAPQDLRPSTPLEPLVQKWPAVFTQQVSRLAPGGLPFTRRNETFNLLITLSYILSGLLFLLGVLLKDPWAASGGVVLYALGWIGAACSGWFPGELKLEAVSNVRGLTEAILEQQQRSGFGAEKS